ncbi:MAG: exosortase system-associated protein, TIGR04073 family [Candidatus Omnitrophota bacterium]|nr:exosortase system-associated protein, TIGR04073 family [Candidatus Omnitrophota bacterium]
MKKGVTKGIIAFLAMAVLLNICAVCYAENALQKLGRGIANVVTGWIEIPKNVYDTSQEENIIMGLTIGLAKGLGMSVIRTGAGIYDTVTFPFPVPEDYEPLLEPEYVLGD